MNREALQKQLSDLQERLAAHPVEELSTSDAQAIWVTVAASLLAITGGLGECRKQKPYSELRPIIDRDGALKWCCNHDPEHCAK